MNNKILLLILLIAIQHGVWAQTTYVLVTGVSRYQDERNNLGQTTKDAKAFKSIWDKQSRNTSILTSKYANRENILEKLRHICTNANEQDRIIFYFSGHGFSGGIAAYDDAIYYNELSEILSRAKARQKVVFVDACHAGSVAKNTEDEGYRSLITQSKSGHIVYFMACRSNEYATEHTWIGHGYFTQALLKGLRGKSDKNGDKKITIMELFRYVYNDVYQRTRKDRSPQHPQLISPEKKHDDVLIEW